MSTTLARLAAFLCSFGTAAVVEFFSSVKL